MATPGRHNFDLRVNSDGYVLAPGIDVTTDFTSGRGKPNHQEESTVQRFPLGTTIWDPSLGRVWKYAKAGGVALTSGKVMQSIVPITGHNDMAIGTEPAGETTISITPVTNPITADQYDEGMFYTNNGSGEGELLRIKTTVAISAAAAGDLICYDPVITAIDAAAKGTVVTHPYKDVIIHPSPPTAPLVGVTNIPVAAASYAFLQILGPCVVLIDGAISAPIMSTLRASDDDDGGAEIFVNDTASSIEQHIGILAVDEGDTEHALVNLTGFGFL